jgi:hypothetical protein
MPSVYGRWVYIYSIYSNVNVIGCQWFYGRGSYIAMFTHHHYSQFTHDYSQLLTIKDVTAMFLFWPGTSKGRSSCVLFARPFEVRDLNGRSSGEHDLLHILCQVFVQLASNSTVLQSNIPKGPTIPWTISSHYILIVQFSEKHETKGKLLELSWQFWDSQGTGSSPK